MLVFSPSVPQPQPVSQPSHNSIPLLHPTHQALQSPKHRIYYLRALNATITSKPHPSAFPPEQYHIAIGNFIAQGFLRQQLVTKFIHIEVQNRSVCDVCVITERGRGWISGVRGMRRNRTLGWIVGGLIPGSSDRILQSCGHLALLNSVGFVRLCDF